MLALVPISAISVMPGIRQWEPQNPDAPDMHQHMPKAWALSGEAEMTARQDGRSL
jgi:hypothetical protein